MDNVRMRPQIAPIDGAAAAAAVECSCINCINSSEKGYHMHLQESKFCCKQSHTMCVPYVGHDSHGLEKRSIGMLNRPSYTPDQQRLCLDLAHGKARHTNRFANNKHSDGTKPQAATLWSTMTVWVRTVNSRCKQLVACPSVMQNNIRP